MFSSNHPLYAFNTLLPPEAMLWPGQQKFLKPPDTDTRLQITLFQGGTCCGKTHAAMLLGLSLCQQTPGITGVVTGTSIRYLKSSVLQRYRQHFDDLGWIPGEDYIWQATERTLIFPKWTNDRGQASRIHFIPYTRGKKFALLAAGWIHMEEARDLPEELYLYLLSRLYQKGVNCYHLFCTTLPHAAPHEEPSKYYYYPTGKVTEVRRHSEQTGPENNPLPCRVASDERTESLGPVE